MSNGVPLLNHSTTRTYVRFRGNRIEQYNILPPRSTWGYMGTASATEYTMHQNINAVGGKWPLKITGTYAHINKQSITFHLTLLGELAPGWELVQPLPIVVEVDEDGNCLYTDRKFGIFGEGHDIASAQKDFISSLIEYYELASEYDDAPSRQLLSLIRLYLQPTPIPHE